MPTNNESERAELLTKMEPPTREVAKRIDRKIAVKARGNVLINFDIGALVRDVIDGGATYGLQAVQQLAEYLELGERTLYDYAAIAKAFDGEFMEEQVKIPMTNGLPLSTYHFVVLARCRGEKERAELLEDIRRSCLSVDELRSVVREATQPAKVGRAPKYPGSPAGGLQKLFAQAQQLRDYLPDLDEHVFSKIDKMPPGKMTKALLDKLLTAQEKVRETIQELQATVERMDHSKERLQLALANLEGSTSDDGKGATTRKRTRQHIQVA